MYNRKTCKQPKASVMDDEWIKTMWHYTQLIPGGWMVKNAPDNTVDMGLIPGP